ALGYSSEEISETRAAQVNFLQRATLYYGTQDQMPDPTMVAVKGAGEVPAYTGIAYIVLKDDETREGEVSQYEFVVANCGERNESNEWLSRLLVTGQAVSLGGARFAVADATEMPEFEGIPTSTGADIQGIPYSYNGRVVVAGSTGSRYSTDITTLWQEIGGAQPNPQCLSGGPNGWQTHLHQGGFWTAELEIGRA